jgi:hypothetical protein
MPRDPYPSEEGVSELSQQFRTALASVLLVIGGADLGRFAGGDMGRLCRAHGPAGRAAA